MRSMTPLTDNAFDGKSFAATLPKRPGVYRMLNAGGEIIYVGKAVSLRDRVGSYFSPRNLHPKVQALVGQIASMLFTVTNSETEALLLEFNLIKEHKPRYNVVLRDDKSFPYLYLSTAHPYPRLSFFRGARQIPGRFFGPFPNAGAVKETLHQVQKLFHVRPCRDSYFANRTRACLQHQIGRCSGPCVGLISRADYNADVAAAIKVLEGRSNELNDELAARMEKAAVDLNFEQAAVLRDQLAALKIVQAQQIIASDTEREADIFALIGEPGAYAVSAMTVRGGRNLGTTTFFPRAALGEPHEALASFIMQYYADTEPPPEVFTNLTLADAEALQQALAERAPRAVNVRRPERGLAVRWVELARDNAEQSLRVRLAARAGIEELFAALALELGLAAPPARIECFDVSHTGGEGTMASCVVWGPEGALKKEYRRFNITGVAPGDDYGALRQALQRRYTRIRDGEFAAPDLLLIDGGAQQIAQVHAVLVELGFENQLLVGVSKGPDRRPGQERLHVYGENAARIPGAQSEALRLIQRIRDEAHRFAITGHRRKRARRFNESVLEAVPGLGPAKRRELLTHFGGLQGIMHAGIADFETVSGIGSALAQALYEYLHPGE